MENKINSDIKIIGDFKVDLISEKVETIDGETIQLTNLTFKLFKLLIQHSPNHVSQNEIIKTVWGNTHVTHETLQQRIKLLRKALGDNSSESKYISTVRGKGYKLIAPISFPPSLNETQSPFKPNFWQMITFSLFGLCLFFGWQYFSHFSQKHDDKIENTQFTPQVPRLAVLPLRALQKDLESQTFAEGLTRQLQMALTYVDELFLIDQRTMSYYSKQSLPFEEIGKELKLTHLLMGEVSRNKEQVFVRISLLQPITRDLVWSQEFDTEFNQIFQIQSQIANAISEKLKVQLSQKVIKTLTRPSASTSAYDYYFQARKYIDNLQKEDNDIAIELSRKAIELDPEFTEAYIELGFGYYFKHSHWDDDREFIDMAIEQAKKAIQLSPENYIAHYLLGLTYQHKFGDLGGQWLDLSRKSYQKAIELNPKSVFTKIALNSTYDDIAITDSLELNFEALKRNPKYPLTHLRIGTLFERMNYNDIAIKWYEKALEIKPDYYRVMSNMAALLQSMGHFERSLELINKILKRYPNRLYEQFEKAELLLDLKQVTEAEKHYLETISKLKEGERIEDGYYIFSHILLASIYKDTGRVEDFNQLIQKTLDANNSRMKKYPKNSWFLINASAIQILLDDEETAIEWVERAIDKGFTQDTWLTTQNVFKKLHVQGKLNNALKRIDKIIQQTRRPVLDSGIISEQTLSINQS